MKLPRIVCIVGPTSSGKTALSLKLAKQFQCEIINADARQLYRGFDIGTGKPDTLALSDIPHHLFQEDPTKQLTVTEWRDKALTCIHQVIGRGHVPILVGGTGLYIQALVDNFSIPEVPPNESLRQELSVLSLSVLVEKLREIDPNASEVVDMQNPRRVMRALEIVLSTGKSLIEQRQKGEPLVEALQIGIERTREELYARADKAVDRMLEHGWANEVKQLLAQGVTKDVPAMSAIGYRELVDVIEGRTVLEETVLLIKQYTRNYIKRQVTWFKKDERIVWAKDEGEAMQCVSDCLG
ncbi:tRNA (adenosine(37)-N6)-dimethylallyltransferase MiaA [Patescibacteria group bacterium]|nr:tRNA (adenosine(37)-N6)-dimethylallyltransferase MiaA [Patescibacteria group bacterium]MBP9710056.1 tRNA (adenosine(37)-N6)-dimethylallyltransferase MiaA [Patescibacteria group bacterium]